MIGLEENSDFEALGIEEFSDTITADVIQSNPDLRTSTEASNGETRSSAAMVDAVWRAVWPHLCCYLLPIDDYTRWFLMDEVQRFWSHSSDVFAFSMATLSYCIFGLDLNTVVISLVSLSFT